MTRFERVPVPSLGVTWTSSGQVPARGYLPWNYITAYSGRKMRAQRGLGGLFVSRGNMSSMCSATANGLVDYLGPEGCAGVDPRPVAEPADTRRASG